MTPKKILFGAVAPFLAIGLCLVSCGSTGSSLFSSLALADSSFSEGSIVSSASSSARTSSSSASSSLDANPLGLPAGDGTYDLTDGISNDGGSLNYEIFVRSFYDSNKDGTGDFNGIAAKASYLKSMGVGTVWLMPINPSPSYHGYDITYYEKVNPNYGTMSDFEAMLATLKAEGIKVIIDMVLNHSSSQNPWFAESYQDYLNSYAGSDSKADWYNWSATNQSSNYHRYGNLYYEGDFGSSMPDFNLDSVTLQAEIKDILNFWLAKGVAGFRLDAVRYYYYGDDGKNITTLDQLVDDVAEAYPDCYFVGENWASQTAYYPYFASKINSFFDFDESITSSLDGTIIGAAKGFSTGDAFSSAIENAQTQAKALNPTSYNSFFISNHDQDRSSVSLSGNTAKLGASLTYLLPGTPYIYYGEEIGLKGVRGPNDNNDVLRRLPMIWSESDKTGQCAFPDPTAIGLESEVAQVTLGAEDLAMDPTSLLSHYEKVGNVRNEFPFIRDAAFTALKTNLADFVAYQLTNGSSSIAVVTNTGAVSASLNVSSFATGILDSINTVNLIPSYQNGILGLGGYSTVILSCK